MPTVCRVVQDPLQDTVDALLPLLGVDRGRRVRRVRHAEEIEDERQHLAKALVHQEQPAGDLRAGRLGTVAIRDPVEGAPHLQHGQHRDRLPVRDAASLEDGMPRARQRSTNSAHRRDLPVPASATTPTT